MNSNYNGKASDIDARSQSNQSVTDASSASKTRDRGSKAKGKRSNNNNRTAPRSSRANSRFMGSPAGRNDFAWYNKNSRLVEATARVPFPYRPGVPIPTYAQSGMKVNAVGATESVNQLQQRLPGVCVLEWHPTAGLS